jgi:amino acid adenylation domain-containing protein
MEREAKGAQGIAMTRPEERTLSELFKPAARERTVTSRRDSPRPELIHALVERQVERSPEAVAVSQGNRAISYVELNAASNRLAHHLGAAGVRTETVVAVLVEPSDTLVVSLLAILKAGAAYLPLTPAQPPERMTEVLHDSRASVVLTDGLGPPIPRTDAAVIHVSDVLGDIGGYPAHNPSTPVDPANLAYVLYTSGSSGSPKGVMVPHTGVANCLSWMKDSFDVCVNDVVLQRTEFGFDASVWEFFLPLISGARLAVLPRDSRADVDALLRYVRDEGISILQLVPSMIPFVLNAGGLADCHALRLVFSGGEPLSPDTSDRLTASTGATVFNLYGPTEASIQVTAFRCRSSGEAGRGTSSVPIGRPIPNVRVRVVDAELETAGLGTVGEICISGPAVGRGYLGDPALTAMKFVPDSEPENPGERTFRTGDLARWLPNGQLVFLSRADDQVKLRGHRVELGEVEAQLLSHPAVSEAAVRLTSSKTGAELRAYIVAAPGRLPPSKRKLQGHLRRKLPPYMVPAHFTVLGSLPRLSSGKVDKRGLAEAAGGAAPGHDAGDRAAWTPLHDLIASVWESTIGERPGSIDDDFFLLGGHSLLVTQAIARLKNETGVELSVLDFFERPTLRLQERLVNERLSAPPTPTRSPSG